jgi:predicted 2-oxoglutarate/Fe(II)-dependent dioxygenase YbiX
VARRAHTDRWPALTAERLGELGVFVVPACLDDATCARVRAAMDRGRATPAEIYVNGYVVDERMRRTFDVEVDPATVAEVERTIGGVRGDVSRFFGIELTAAEGSGFLRYRSGGFYLAHRDRLDDSSGEDFPRQISVVLFLTTAMVGAGDGPPPPKPSARPRRSAHGSPGAQAGRCEGGALRLHGLREAALDIPPTAGTLIAFRSGVLHEVLPVTGGVRDAIVDWFY